MPTATTLRLLCIGIVTFAAITETSSVTAQGGGQTTGTPAILGSRGQTTERNMFESGQGALASGHLREAERAFRDVLILDPLSADAYANLGVVYMRMKQWELALATLQKASQLSPEVDGIRLNIGLSYYRQNRFRKAIPAFESVVRDSPASVQARYLLGLCYFFTEDYSDATNTLKYLKEQLSNNWNFLYVLENSAWRAKEPELEQWALARLVEVGSNRPEFHLLMGRANLNRGEYDEAIKELLLAQRTAPRLPFLHFTLGSVYMKQQDIDHAKHEFLEDSRTEPDVAYNYDQLGVIEFKYHQHAKQAEQYFRLALKLDPELISSHYQLACVYLSESRLIAALSEIDRARALAPQNSPIRYVRGRILQRLGRTGEAKKEWQVLRHQGEEELEGGIEPSKLLESGSGAQ